MTDPRDLPKALATGFAVVLLVGAYLLVPSAARSTMMSVTAWVAIAAAMAWFPEALVVGCLFAGRFSYESRLALKDTPFSLNQLLLFGVVFLMLVRRGALLAALRQVSAWGLIAFVAMLTAWTLWTIGPEYGADKVLRHLFVVLPAVLGGIAMIRWRGNLQWMFLALWGFGLGLSVVSALTGSTDTSGRATALGSGPIVFSRNAGAAMLIAVLVSMAALRARSAPTSLRWLVGGVGLSSAVAMLPTFVLAQSRGPALSLLVSLLVVGVLLAKGDLRRSALVGGIGAAAVLAGVLVIQTLAGPSRYSAASTDATSSFRERAWMLERSYGIVIDHPMLGVGTGGWPVEVYGIDYKAYPHNFFAEVGAENGLPVLVSLWLLFFGLALLALRDWLRAPDCLERDALLISFALFGYTLATIQFSGDVVDNRMIWLALGMMEAAQGFLRVRFGLHPSPFSRPGGAGTSGRWTGVRTRHRFAPMTRPHLLILLLLALLLPACPGPAPQSLPQLPVDPGSLRETLGPGDVFEVRVFEEEALTGTSRIEADGNFTYPLLGTVHAGGLTASELADLLAERLADGYLRAPQVTVFVQEHNSRQVSVIGQVQKPGRYPFRSGMTLVEAIAEAGGTTDTAVLSTMRVTRLVKGQELSADIPFKEITQGRIPDFELQAGDMVFVAESAIK